MRNLIPNAMEVCILLLDPDAEKYTSPLQCALYETPVSCQACKRDRPAVQKATFKKKPVVVSQSEPIRRMDHTLVTVGPEYAIPVLIENRVFAVVSVVIQPFTKYTRKDFFFPVIRKAQVQLFRSIINVCHSGRSAAEIRACNEALTLSRKVYEIPGFPPARE